MPSVADALDALRGRRAVVVGDLMLDAYIYGETVRVSREAPVIVVRKEQTEYRLGGAANTAANLSALGVTTELIGTLGCDDAAGHLARSLSECGVDATHLARVDRTTPVKTRVLAGAFGTSRQQVLRLDDEPQGAVPDEVVDAVARDLEERAAGADVLLVSDYGLGLFAPPVIAVVRRLGAAGHTVCVDSRHRLASFGGVTVVKPNVPEAEAVTGLSICDEASAARAGQQVVERLGCQACLLTQGRGGMTLITAAGRVSHVAIVGPEEVTDVTGAGDTVMAVFSAALAGGVGMENAMRLSNCAAGQVVTRLGTAALEPAEIIEAAAHYGVELKPWAA